MLNPDFKELLRLFNANRIEYLLVGGYAMAAHGYPRYTGDIDLWVWSTRENSVKIIKALREFGFGELGLTEEDFLKPQQVIQLGSPPTRIDLLTDIDGVTFSGCWPGRLIVDLGGIPVPVIGKPDLIRNKESSNRMQDRADL
jgi:hypothetical protein